MIEHIGRYKILGQLGQGAMAIVYKAHDPKIDRTLAIKVLRKEKCLDGEYRMRFLRESKAAGNLSHPNIVTIYDVGEHEHQPYIAMELLPGTPLDTLMKSGKRFTRAEIVSIGVQLATALDYAHKRGIVHRDIKPSNIVCSFTNDGSAELKITDFGIAHFEDTGVTQQTKMGDILGTPLYMSPEQVLGQKLDGRSDLFSLGVILYQLYTGQKPFKGTTVTTLLFQIATEEPVPINQLIDNFPADLKRIIDRLLKKPPHKRFQSGNELANAFRVATRTLNNIPQPRKPPMIISLPIKWAFAMGVVVTIIMSASIYFIYHKQQQIITDQVIEFGVSLTKFIAVDSAEPILGEDWVSVEIYVHEVSERQNFSFLSVIDRNNIIRGHSEKDKIGTLFNSTLFNNSDSTENTSTSNSNTNMDIIKKYFMGKNFIKKMDASGDTQVFNITHAGREIFSFSTPILYQNKNIGRVYLGLSKQQLLSATNTTLYMLALLSLIVIVTVSIFTYVLSNSINKPIKTLKIALEEVSSGRAEYRIEQQRHDEFGKLYSTFDTMAESLQTKNETVTLKRKQQ